MCTCIWELGLSEKWGSAARAVTLDMLPDQQGQHSLFMCTWTLWDTQGAQVHTEYTTQVVCAWAQYEQYAKYLLNLLHVAYECLEDTGNKLGSINWKASHVLWFFPELPFPGRQYFHWRQTASPICITGEVGAKKEEIRVWGRGDNGE